MAQQLKKFKLDLTFIITVLQKWHIPEMYHPALKMKILVEVPSGEGDGESHFHNLSWEIDNFGWCSPSIKDLSVPSLMISCYTMASFYTV